MNIINYKRLKDAKKCTSLTVRKNYSALSNTQKIFLHLQMKNVTEKQKVYFSTFCTKIKSALKSISKEKVYLKYI